MAFKKVPFIFNEALHNFMKSIQQCYQWMYHSWSKHWKLLSAVATLPLLACFILSTVLRKTTASSTALGSHFFLNVKHRSIKREQRSRNIQYRTIPQKPNKSVFDSQRKHPGRHPDHVLSSHDWVWFGPLLKSCRSFSLHVSIFVISANGNASLFYLLKRCSFKIAV